MKEIWKNIKEHPDYWVSNIGRVRSNKYNKTRFLVPVKTQDNYLRVKLDYKAYLIHRLVAFYFITKPNGKDDINHIDGDKHNNTAHNLEWVTKKENIFHNMKMGRHNIPASKTICVETGQIFESQTEAGRVLNICPQNISKVVVGERKRAGGFTFRRVS